MKEIILRALIFVTACNAVILVAGCEPEPTSSAKQERLFAAENIELKKQIEYLKEKHKKAMASKQSQLEKCQHDNEELNRMIQEETVKSLQEDVINMLSQESQRLQEENLQLKAQIEELTK